MWQVINDIKKTSCLVLTTHSMVSYLIHNFSNHLFQEEADAICDRIMIMADGEVKCIGLSADLKSRFGEGYKLSVQVARNGNEEEVHKFILELVPQAVLINKLSGTRHYQVPKKSITLDKVFQHMEENKERLRITDWAITNTTLEEVFLRISHQHNQSDTKEDSAAIYVDDDDISICEENNVELMVMKTTSRDKL